jgi:hypothetical protein
VDKESGDNVNALDENGYTIAELSQENSSAESRQAIVFGENEATQMVPDPRLNNR